MKRGLRFLMEDSQGGLVSRGRTPVPAEPLRWQLGAGPDCRRLTVQGIELALEDSGPADGPVLIGLHAAGQGSGDFALLRPLLDPSWRFITVDWPGHGRSAPGRRAFSASAAAELLAGLLPALGVRQAVLLGNSIGGAAAIRYAAVCPDRVAALVLCNPGGLAPQDRAADRFCRAMVRLGRAGARGSVWFAPFYALFYRLMLPRPSARAQRRRIVAAGREMAPLLADAWDSFRRPSEDVRAMAARLRCPVLFAWAGSDRIISLKRSRSAITAVPDHRLSLFKGGHCAYLEDVEAFALTLNGFLNEATVRTRIAPADGPHGALPPAP